MGGHSHPQLVPADDEDDEMTSQPGLRGQRMPRSERRAQLLEAAQAVFVARGYHAAAMDEIADRAGVSKPVLYQHFPGKLELYVALLDRHCDALENQVREALALPAEDNTDRVMATIGAYYGFVGQEGAAFRMVFESDLTSVPQVRQRLDAVEMTCAELLADVISQDTGLDDERAMLLGVALAGMAQITARHWLAQGTDLSRDDAARLVGALAWRGLGSFPKVGDHASNHGLDHGVGHGDGHGDSHGVGHGVGHGDSHGA